MSFVNKIGKGLKVAVSGTASVTKEFLDITRLNASVNAREREIERAYTAMGRILFERECNDPASPVAQLCQKILANQSAVAEMKTKIVHLKEDAKQQRRDNAASLHEDSAEVPTEEIQAEDEAVDVPNAEEVSALIAEGKAAVEEMATELPVVVEEASPVQSEIPVDAAIQIVSDAGVSDSTAEEHTDEQ